MTESLNYSVTYSFLDTNFTNTTDSSEHGDNPDSLAWAWLGLSIIPMWMLSGNLLVLLSVWFHRRLRTLSNWVIASLAFTDLCLSLTVVPLGLYQLVSCRYIFSIFHNSQSGVATLLSCITSIDCVGVGVCVCVCVWGGG